MITLYRLALLAFPRRHRDLYAAEMLDAFDRQRAGRATALGRLTFIAAACVNALGAGIAERRRHHVIRLGYAFSALDFTLAWRMLRRDPGLSVIGVFGMAVGIAVAAGAFSIISALMDPRLPLRDGDRLVSMVNDDITTGNTEMRLLHDLARWRALTSLDTTGHSRSVTLNLIADGRTPEPITLAEMTASAFDIAAVTPLRGRYLLPDDERAGAPGVLVIGESEWVRRFDADPDILGRPVKLGATTYEIVGVMPDSFGFPSNHTFWIPWRLDTAAYAPRTGPIVTVFGRLAPGMTIEAAQAELTEIGRRASADFPATHEHLRPRVMPYAFVYTDMGEPDNMLAMRAIQYSLVLLLVIVCVNVAILVYARTATRQGEIAVRSALGASRLRIVTQLFVEALTLAGVAAAAGVFLVAVAMPQLQAAFLSIVGGRMPFWLDFRVDADVVRYVIALTLLAAAIIGVLPALKATGTRVQSGLQMLSPGSGSRMQMGRLWTLLIVAQVAMTVALLPAAMFFTWDGLRLRTGDAGFASRDMLSASIAMDHLLDAPAPEGNAAFDARVAVAHRMLDEQLRAQPTVADVTFAQAGVGEELAMALEAEGEPNPGDPINYNIVEGSKTGHLVRYNRVAANFFDAFAAPVMLGRGFTTADAGTDRVLVNRALATMVFGDTNPLGRRVKYVGRSREASERDPLPLEQWYEIVGVVPDFPVNEVEPTARLYHAAAFGDVYPVRLNVRVRATDPAAFSGTLRDVSAAVNPNLQIRDITTAAIVVRREQAMFRMIGVTVGMVMLSVIVLSAAGIYALMSFTVARRRREIGIRAALGASRNRLLLGIFSRALAQLGAGVTVGAIGAAGLEQILEGEMLQGRGAVILPLVAAVMVTVGVLAAYGPARQGLSIQPTEALREE